MSNRKHSKCELRSLASEAKQRLQKNEYTYLWGPMSPPRGVTPQQRSIYMKLRELKESGEEIENPIQQLADADKLRALSHEERQRYILQLSADYVSMKRALENNEAKQKEQA